MIESETPLVIHGDLLASALRRQARKWALPGLLAAVAVTVAALALMPQAFTASSSVAVQEPSGAGSSLALLSGQSASKRYVGVVKSRWAAEQVERQVHLGRLYGLPHTKAVQLLIHSVQPEDNAADGLFYVGVTLKGPPALSPGRLGRDRVRQAAADAANAYVAALCRYYTDNDNTRDSVLLRGAEGELQHAQTAFDQASSQLRAFGQGLRGEDASLMASAGDAASGALSPVGATKISKLYDAMADLDTQLRAADAARQTQRRMVGTQLSDLAHLPSEDPLLTQARSRVSLDQTQLANLQVQFGPDNPDVVMAQARLKIDSDALRRQAQGVAHALTTDQVQSQTTLDSLQARRQALAGQLAQAERHFNVSRSLSGEFQRRESEVTLRFEVLKTTMTEAAKVRMENASTTSRMSVVDHAEAPLSGTPGTSLLAAASVGLVLLLLAASVAQEYSRESRALEAREAQPAARIAPIKAA